MTTATLPYAPARAAAIANLDPFFGPDAPPLPDSEPLPDAMQQNPYILHLMQILADVLTQHRSVFVDTNSIVYYDPANGNRRFQPDIYAAFDVDAAAIWRRNGYVIWEVGKPPDFVLEVASETTADHDTGRKRDLYAAIGIKEYWRFDAAGDLYGQRLVGEYLDADGVYQPFPLHTEGDDLVWGYSPLLDLNLRWHDGWPELQDPATGEILLDRRGVRLAMEAAQREWYAAQQERDAAQQNLDAVQQQTQAARQERDAALAAAADYREQVRQLQERLREREQPPE